MSRIIRLPGAFIVGTMVLLIASQNSASAQDAWMNAGVFGGLTYSTASEAVDGYSETEFESGAAYGGSLFYSPTTTFNGGVELMVERFSMDLEEDGEDFGTLNMTPILVLFKFQGRPAQHTGFTGHGDIGAGVALTSFDKGAFVTDLENAYDVRATIDTDPAFVFTFGAGLDYFFTSQFSLFLDGRLNFMNVDTDWKFSGPVEQASVDINSFRTSNVQVLIGIKAWIK
ncbi:MAG: hypothetical protein ABFD81_06430 [Syntrophaceae bacterium]